MKRYKSFSLERNGGKKPPYNLCDFLLIHWMLSIFHILCGDASELREIWIQRMEGKKLNHNLMHEVKCMSIEYCRHMFMFGIFWMMIIFFHSIFLYCSEHIAGWINVQMFFPLYIFLSFSIFFWCFCSQFRCNGNYNFLLFKYFFMFRLRVLNLTTHHNHKMF